MILWKVIGIILQYELYLLFAGLVIISALYSSVGHGGASGYLAILSISSYGLMSHIWLKQHVWIMNLIVASIAFYHYNKAGFHLPRLTIPFIVASIPMAFIGGVLNIDADLIWNHALDNNTGDPVSFGPAICPTWQTPANTVYTFNGSSQTTASFNVNSTNVVGTKLDDSAFDVGGGAWTFSYYLKVTGSGTHYSLLNRDVNYQYSFSMMSQNTKVLHSVYFSNTFFIRN